MKIIRTLCVFLSSAALALAAVGCGPSATNQADYIGLDTAKAIALGAAGVSEAQADFSSTTGLDHRGSTDFYAIDFTANGQSYTFDIDAITGIIISGPVDIAPAASAAPEVSANPSASPSPSVSPSNAPTILTEAQAREIALNHAGQSADQVTFLKSNLGYDNGRQVYDIEFYTAAYTEYDYEIDASTGQILSYDYDAEGYTPPTPGTTTITADEAKQIALAKVPGATVSNIYEFELDRDDGRLEYEGTIYYNGMEYEFTIDGYSGALRSWEVESAWD